MLETNAGWAIVCAPFQLSLVSNLAEHARPFGRVRRGQSGACRGGARVAQRGIPPDVGGRVDDKCMADIDIRELIAYEPYCAECGQTGPIETSSFLAFAWEQAHDCATAAASREVRVAS